MPSTCHLQFTLNLQSDVDHYQHVPFTGDNTGHAASVHNTTITRHCAQCAPDKHVSPHYIHCASYELWFTTMFVQWAVGMHLYLQFHGIMNEHCKCFALLVVGCQKCYMFPGCCTFVMMPPLSEQMLIMMDIWSVEWRQCGEWSGLSPVRMHGIVLATEPHHYLGISHVCYVGLFVIDSSSTLSTIASKL